MKIKVADRIEQIQEYYFSKKLREIAALQKSGVDIINLGVGSPDQLPAPEVIQQLCDEVLREGHHGYQSYTGIPELRRALAVWYDRHFKVAIQSDREALPLIGSKEGIMHISMTYLQAGDEILIPDPGYLTYASAARLAGATIRHYNLIAEAGWLPDLNALEKTNLSKVKIMWVNYPHMPTGAAATLDDFAKMVSFCHKHEILLCHDNPYTFILNKQPLSIFQVPGAKDVALELTSLSKSFNMAGWRVGFLTGHADRIKEVLRFKSNMDSGMFKPLQLAAAKALSLDDSWFDQINRIYQERRSKVEEILQALECPFDPNQVGMFVWAKVPEGFNDGYIFSDFVLSHAQVFITPGNIFGKNGRKYIRISLCSNMTLLEEALKRCQSINQLVREN